MRGYAGRCENCLRQTQLYVVCHLHEPFLQLCGACNKADQTLHRLERRVEFKEVHIQRVYMRRYPVFGIDFRAEQCRIIRQEKAFSRDIYKKGSTGDCTGL